MKTQLLSLFFFLVLFSCKEKGAEPQLTEESVKSSLVGKWQNTSFAYQEYGKDGTAGNAGVFQPVKAYYTFAEKTFNYEETNSSNHKIEANSIPYGIEIVKNKATLYFTPPADLWFIKDVTWFAVEKINSNEMQWKSEVINRDTQRPGLDRTVWTGRFIR